MSTLTITGLHIYPVKSMKGISLEKAPLTAKGLENDRRWMVVDMDGRFVTQKDIPQLALINTSLVDNGVMLSLPGSGETLVPFSMHHGDSVKTNVWGSHCEAIDQGQQVSKWLTAALENETPLRLVRMHPGFQRSTRKARVMGQETSTVFADLAPYLLAGEASLDRLNSELASSGHQPVPMDRFRPNIVIRGLEPFAEHKLQGVCSNDYALTMRLHCERCVVTTIDQETASKDPHQQPFKTLKAINPMPDKKAGPAFGHYATLSGGDGAIISLGEPLQAVI